MYTFHAYFIKIIFVLLPKEMDLPKTKPQNKHLSGKISAKNHFWKSENQTLGGPHNYNGRPP